MKKIKFLAGLACLSFGIAASAQSFPSRPITLIVPFGAGGITDQAARLAAMKVADHIGQPVLVENKPGANGQTAIAALKQQPADGHTLLWASIGTHAINASLYPRLNYDPVKDFEPVGMVGSSATLMVLNPAVKANNAKEVVAMLKAAPDKTSYASAGNGTAPHFAAELFKLSTGTSMLHVPYKGTAPAITDTIAGQTQVMFPSLFTAMPYVKGGKLKAVGVAGAKRSALMPDVPTLQEQGIADVDVSQWYGIFAPAKTPKPVIEQLNKVLNEVLADKTVIKRLEDHGAEVSPMTIEQMRTYVAQEQVKWKKVVQAAKITAE